jgi:hypothetical protein
MSYPGQPPNEQQGGQPYGYHDPNAGGGYPPAPDQGYGQQQPQPPSYSTEPISPAYGAPTQQVAFGQPVPQQPQPMHDQGAFGQPAFGQPASGGPAYNGGTAQIPTYADPTSGYGAYGAEQMSGPPMSGPPGMAPQAYPPVNPPRKRGVAVPILASLLALSVIAAVVFIGLYVSESGKLDKSQKLAADRQTSLTATNADLDKTKKDLQAKTDELTQAQQDLRGSKNDSEQAKKERDVIAKCLTLLTQALSASNAGDKATVDAKVKEMDQPCAQAFDIIGIN